MRKRIVVLIFVLLPILMPPPAQAFDLVSLIIWFVFWGRPSDINNTQLIVNSNERAADAINKVRRRIYELETKMQMMIPPEICKALELMRKAKLADLNIAKMTKELEHQMVTDILTRADPFGYDLERIQTHNQRYCTAAEAQAGLCEQEGKLPGGDTSAAGLLSLRGYDAEQEEAARAFLRNLINPSLLKLPSNALANTAQAAQYRALQMEYAARKSMALYGVGTLFGDRKRMGKGGSAQALDGASPLEIFVYDMERRFGDEAWVKEIIHNTDGANNRARLLAQVWDMRMQYRLHQQWERNNALLATLVAIMTEQAAGDKLRLLNEATQKGVRPVTGENSP